MNIIQNKILISAKEENKSRLNSIKKWKLFIPLKLYIHKCNSAFRENDDKCIDIFTSTVYS